MASCCGGGTFAWESEDVASEWALEKISNPEEPGCVQIESGMQGWEVIACKTRLGFMCR